MVWQNAILFFSRKTHVSWLIMNCCIGILLGTIGCIVVRDYFAGIGWLIVACIFLFGVFWKRNRGAIALCIVAGALVGAWRGGIEIDALNHWQSYYGKTVTMRGVVVEDVTHGKGGEKHLVLKENNVEGRVLTGEVWVRLRSDTNIRRSDVVEISTTISRGFGSFVAAGYEGKLVRHISGNDTARDMRDNFADKVRQSIQEPAASLGIGFLVGQKSTLPGDLEDQLRIAGLTHIVVASGYNLTILLRMTRRLLASVSKYLTGLSGGGLIVGFLLVTGASPSMVRAALVSGLSLAAWYYGRHISPFVLLLIVAAISILINPSYMWGDVGWYLSFAAFAGVMLFAPLLQDYFFSMKKPGWARQIAGETFAALLFTLPITIVVFGSYSLYALPANFMIVPFVPFAMLLTFLAGMGAIVLPAAAFWWGFPAQKLLDSMIACIEWWARQPGAQGEAKTTALFVIVYYGVLLCVFIYLLYQTKHDFRGDNIIE